MKHLFRNLLWVVCTSSVLAGALPAHADVLFAVRALREGGCGGILPAAPPLHRNSLLDRSAEEWAAGRGLSQAVELSGYRASSAAGLHVRGADEEMLQLLKRAGCGTLASQGLHEMGLYRRGFDAWIVLATGHELTAGAIRKAPDAGVRSSAAVVQAPVVPPLRRPELPEEAAEPARAATAPTASAAAVPVPMDSTRTARSRKASAGAELAAASDPRASAPTAPAAAGLAATPRLAARPAGGAVAAPGAAGAVVAGPVAAGPKATLSPILATRALQLVNNVRARGTRCGGEVFGPAPPVTLSPTLAGVAFGHASDMAQNNYFEHNDLHGNTPSDRVRASGYQEKLVGENIAYGPKSVDEAVQGWLDSPGHCENIMDPRFAEMGLGYATSYDSNRRLYWVQLLAEPRKLASR